MKHITPRLKHWLFDMHWFITTALLVLIFFLWASMPTLRSWAFLYPAVGAVLGLSYFALRQQIDETRLFSDLFKSFNARYDQKNDRLHELCSIDVNQTLELEEKVFLYDYFNLCAEEYLYYAKGFIYPEVWQAWVAGMKIFYQNARIRRLWDSELATKSYYGFRKEFLTTD